MASTNLKNPPPGPRAWRRASEAALFAPIVAFLLLAGANRLVVVRAEANMRAAARAALIEMARGEIGPEAAARQVAAALGDPDRRTYAVAITEGAHRRIEITAPRSAAGVIGPFGLQAFGQMTVEVYGPGDAPDEGEAARDDPLGRVTRREAAALRLPSDIPQQVP